MNYKLTSLSGNDLKTVRPHYLSFPCTFASARLSSKVLISHWTPVLPSLFSLIRYIFPEINTYLCIGFFFKMRVTAKQCRRSVNRSLTAWNGVLLQLADRQKKRGLIAQSSCFWAENGTRTRDLNLGKVALYQLSYFRNLQIINHLRV